MNSPSHQWVENIPPAVSGSLMQPHVGPLTDQTGSLGYCQGTNYGTYPPHPGGFIGGVTDAQGNFGGVPIAPVVVDPGGMN